MLVTRPAGQAQELVALLAERGIDAMSVPTVEIAPAAPGGALDAALASLDDAAWLVITSANGADAVAGRLNELGMALPATTRIAAVGAGTAARMESHGHRVDHVPATYRTAAIAEGMGDVAGKRVVLARADAASPELRDALIARHALVDDVVSYRTVEAPVASRDRLRLALHAPLDGVTFTSGSTVRGLTELASAIDARRATTLPAFCIGPVTADVARNAGFWVPVVAAPHTAPALASAIHDYLFGASS
jgi:uroporphyrinogen-III synthase